MQSHKDSEPETLEQGVAIADAAAETAAKQLLLAALRAKGFVSVAEVRWLEPNNDAPPLRPLLTVKTDTGSVVMFMPTGKVIMLAAPGGTGKTQILVQLAIAIAGGKPWLETYDVPTPGHVLLVVGEEDNDELHRRIRGAVGATQAWGESDLIDANLHVLSIRGQAAGLTDKDGGPTEFFKELRGGLAALPGIEFSMIILDPASRFLGPEAEIDNAAATRWIEHAEELTQLPGRPTVLFAHHTNKNALGGETDQGAARGSSALTDGARWQANLDRVMIQDKDEKGHNKGKPYLDPSHVILRVVKANYCAIAPPLLLVRDLERGGFLKPGAGNWGQNASEGKVNPASKATRVVKLADAFCDAQCAALSALDLATEAAEKADAEVDPVAKAELVESAKAAAKAADTAKAAMLKAKANLDVAERTAASSKALRPDHRAMAAGTDNDDC